MAAPMPEPGQTGRDAVLRHALWLLAPAITLVVASEFVVVGLLPLVAGELGVSLAEAGRLTGLFAVSAAVAGPGLTLLASRWPPRHVMAATLLLFALGNAVMAWASDFSLLLMARIAQGAVLPAFISVGAAVVTALAPPERRGRALANANLGFVLGVLLALPAGAALAQWGSWRLPFMLLTVGSLVAAVVIGRSFPVGRPADAPCVAEQLALLRRPTFLGHLLVTILLFASMFAAYTFVGAWLDASLALSGSQLAIALLLFSAVGVLGNGLAARVADSAPVAATVTAVLALVAAINLAQAFVGVLPAMVVLLGVWSVAHTAGVTLSQVRVTMAGDHAPAFAMTLNISCANLGIAAGAFAGGWGIDRWGLDAIGWVPITFAALVVVLSALLVLPPSRRPRPLGQRRESAG